MAGLVKILLAIIILFAGLAAAALLVIPEYLDPLFPLMEQAYGWAAWAEEMLFYAVWYVPVFLFFFGMVLFSRRVRRRLLALLVLSLIPFVTAVIYLHLLFTGTDTPIAGYLIELLGRNPAVYTVFTILVLELILFFLGAVNLFRDDEPKRQAAQSELRRDEAAVLKVLPKAQPELLTAASQDDRLSFPEVPGILDMKSFRKYQQRRSADEMEPDAFERPDERELPAHPPVPPKRDAPQDIPESSREDERSDAVLAAEGTYETQEDLSPLAREPVDLVNTVTPTLPPEDPKFHNLPHSGKQKDQDEAGIDHDWDRRESEAGTKRKRRGIIAPMIDYVLPPESLLSSYPQAAVEDDAYTKAAANALMQTFREFGIEAKLTGIQKGPVVTMFEILPAPGVRVSAVTNLSDNIALQLAASRVRIVAPIPGKQAVGIEVPNRRRTIVSFKEMLDAMDEHNHYKIPMVLGKDIMGRYTVIDLVRTPHLLIAGATGSGKSVCVNSLINSILYRRSPKDVRMILIDPKIVELKLYNDIPHLLTPVITEPKKTLKALQYCIYEMERRYQLLDALGVRDISSYNRKVEGSQTTAETIPYIVVVLDEFADLMNTIGKELEQYLARLAAMARAVGIHLVLATQRPSTNVITGLIKANIPSRIAFMVVSNTDSRIIIDMPGAEKLLGKGDMLFLSSWEAYPTRIQGAFVSEEEVERVVEYVKSFGEPDYLDESYFLDDDESDDDSYNEEDYENDPLMPQAMRIIQERSVASASMLQRRLKIGYNRAARIIEAMEEMGIVGPAQGSKPREVLRYQEFRDG